MNLPTFTYQWQWHLQSSPGKLWPWVADTDRFNRETGLPYVRILENLGLGVKKVEFRVCGIPVEWKESPFEWVWPSKFEVLRQYSKGPMKEMLTRVALSPGKPGTLLTYKVDATPKNLLGLLAIPLVVGFYSKYQFNQAFKHYDILAQMRKSKKLKLPTSVFNSWSPKENYKSYMEELLKAGLSIESIRLLLFEIESGDSMHLATMRPYDYAHRWKMPREDILRLFLQATRVGLLVFEWDILCPLCRGVRSRAEHLKDLSNQVHCESCNVTTQTDFERYVELTFYPNSSVRKVERLEYCVGGPMLTSHIFFQQKLLVASSTRIRFRQELPLGKYRLRALGLPGYASVQVSQSPVRVCQIEITNHWSTDTRTIGPRSEISIINRRSHEVFAVFERTEWADTSTTAADVIALQAFRDLFASEALRPGQRISVGSVAIVFTDLKGSTQLYRTIGDAHAFGHVMTHFDVLKETITNYHGAIVKTIGDAVMAVFQKPLDAVRAMLEAQQKLSKIFKDPELRLKAGVHYGPCIAVTLNDRLDYFGTTVNLAARLEGQTSGSDLVITQTVMNDPAVVKWTRENKEKISSEQFKLTLKGFEEDTDLVRIRKIT